MLHVQGQVQAARARRFFAWSSGAMLAALVLAGSFACDKAHRAVAPTAPTATSPEGAVRGFEWAFMHRDAGLLEQILTDDFQFVTAASDTAGNVTSEQWDRARVLQSVRNLFVGDPTGPGPAERITLVLDSRLDSQPDPLHDPITHRMIHSGLVLQVVSSTGDLFETSGSLTFLLSRGDVSRIPAGATGSPAPNSSQRWWIRGIVDETSPEPAANRRSANPTLQTTLGRILTLYWNPR